MGLMRRAIKLGVSKEEKVANRITTILSDFTLDLEAIGFYLAKGSPHIIYTRANEVLEAMQYNKEVDQLDRGVYYGTR
jgi:2'-5' RNA ligase